MFRLRVTGPFVGGLLAGVAIAVTVLAVEAFRPAAHLVSAGSPWSLGLYGPTDVFATIDLRLLVAAGALVAVLLARFFVLDLTTAGGFDPLSLVFLAVFAVWVAAPTLLVGLVPMGVGAGLVLCAVVGLDRAWKRGTETSNEGYR